MGSWLPTTTDRNQDGGHCKRTKNHDGERRFSCPKCSTESVLLEVLEGRDLRLRQPAARSPVQVVGEQALRRRVGAEPQGPSQASRTAIRISRWRSMVPLGVVGGRFVPGREAILAPADARPLETVLRPPRQCREPPDRPRSGDLGPSASPSSCPSGRSPPEDAGAVGGSEGPPELPSPTARPLVARRRTLGAEAPRRDTGHRARSGAYPGVTPGAPCTSPSSATASPASARP